PSVTYTLSLHDALPILNGNILAQFQGDTMEEPYTSIAVQDVVYMNDILVMTTTAQWRDGLENKLDTAYWVVGPDLAEGSVFVDADRKSTRLNSSHVKIS